MDKALRVVKVNIMDMKKTIIFFYIAIFIQVIFFINIGQYGGGFFPVVMDVFTSIILFSTTSGRLKDKFHFSQANNISRKTLIKGSIISIFPIAAIMAVIDFAINRTMNVFIKAPTFYDIFFTSFRGVFGSREISNWVQDGSLTAIIGSIIFSFMLYSIVSIMGLLSGVINLRTSDKFQVIISLISLGVLILVNNISGGVLEKIQVLIENRLGFVMVLIYIVIFGVGIIGSIKLIRKASIK